MDIVGQLRDQASWYTQLGSSMRDVSDGKMLTAAADEIARLRDENEALASNLRGKHATTGATYAHLIAERDRLRDELTAARKTNSEWLAANGPGGWINDLRDENGKLLGLLGACRDNLGGHWGDTELSVESVGCPDAVPARVKEAFDSLRDENAKLREDQDECDALRSKLTDILTRTANALRGEPGELQSHSWHDLPEWAQRARDESATLQAEMERAAIACSHHEAQMARGILIAAMQKGE